MEKNDELSCKSDGTETTIAFVVLTMFFISISFVFVMHGVSHGFACAEMFAREGASLDPTIAASAGCGRATTETIDRRVRDPFGATSVVVSECEGRARIPVVMAIVEAFGKEETTNGIAPYGRRSVDSVVYGTSLHACSAAGCFGCCWVLLRAGASTTTRDTLGRTPFDVATSVHVADLLTKWEERPIIEATKKDV